MVGSGGWLLVNNSDIGGQIEIRVQSTSSSSLVIVLPDVGVAGIWSLDTFLDAGTFIADIRGDCGEDAGNIVASSVANTALILGLQMCADLLETSVTLFRVAVALECGSDTGSSQNRSDKCNGKTHLSKL